MIISDSIKVKNYKCFRETLQGFEKMMPINVIIGKNNSGKSSLIDLVSYVIQPYSDFIGDINSTRKTNLPVYYNDLSMIPVVKPVCQKIEMHFLKWINLNSGSSHSFLYLFLDIRASKIIINETNLHAFSCF